jgi:hypothetical protein
MSDHLTQQDAAALWREIDARVDQRVAKALAAQTGIVPGVAYGSVIFDSAGRATWGGAGGGGGELVLDVRKTTAQTVTSANAGPYVDFEDLREDPYSAWDNNGSHAHYIIPEDGIYLAKVSIRWVASTAWDIGDETGLYVQPASGSMGTTGTVGWLAYRSDIASSGVAIKVHLHGTLPFYGAAGDFVDCTAFQTTGGNLNLGGDTNTTKFNYFVIVKL